MFKVVFDSKYLEFQLNVERQKKADEGNEPFAVHVVGLPISAL